MEITKTPIELVVVFLWSHNLKEKFPWSVPQPSCLQRKENIRSVFWTFGLRPINSIKTRVQGQNLWTWHKWSDTDLSGWHFDFRVLVKCLVLSFFFFSLTKRSEIHKNTQVMLSRTVTQLLKPVQNFGSQLFFHSTLRVLSANSELILCANIIWVTFCSRVVSVTFSSCLFSEKWDLCQEPRFYLYLILSLFFFSFLFFLLLLYPPPLNHSPFGHLNVLSLCKQSNRTSQTINWSETSVTRINLSAC